MLTSCSAAMVVAVSSSAPAAAASAAGTRISNVAQVRTVADGVDHVVTSNQVDLIVAELLDVVLVRSDPGPVVRIIGGDTAVAVVITNTGNGDEAFDVSAAFDDGSAVVRAIAIDRDGDGRFDPAHDELLAAGRTPPIASTDGLPLLVLVAPSSGPATATTLTVVARAVTGTGMVGMLFPGHGDGGGDAVVGETGATARLVVQLAGGEEPSLVKTQSVRAPDGSTQPVAGAIVTYSLAARFPEPTLAVRIADMIPAGTAYLPGSLRLDAMPLSDAPDGDAGTADAGGIAVALGDVAAATARTIQFQVKIQ